MREYKFRGKRISDGEWVYGGIVKTFHPNFPCSGADWMMQVPNCYAICANGKDYFVEQETIGQYTGFDDKNNKEIYEGDIVRLFCDCSGYYIEPRWVNAIIVWDEDFYGWEISFEHIRVGYSECIGNFEHDYDAQIEVIGNIYDNHNLVKNILEDEDDKQ